MALGRSLVAAGTGSAGTATSIRAAGLPGDAALGTIVTATGLGVTAGSRVTAGKLRFAAGGSFEAAVRSSTTASLAAADRLPHRRRPGFQSNTGNKESGQCQNGCEGHAQSHHLIFLSSIRFM